MCPKREENPPQAPKIFHDPSTRARASCTFSRSMKGSYDVGDTPEGVSYFSILIIDAP